jgi:hypothetical protein
MELLAATGLLAVIAAAVFLVARPSLANDEPPITRLAAPLTSALSAWQETHVNQCPTLGLLEDQGVLERGFRREDPWGGSFRVACGDGELSLLSPGPDGVLGSKDDVRIAVR